MFLLKLVVTRSCTDTDDMLRSYSGHNLSQKQRVFNYRLCRARRYVECAFGIMSNKWRIFHRPIDVSPKFAKNIVKACVILHNIVRKRDGYRIDDIISSERSSLETLSSPQTNPLIKQDVESVQPLLIISFQM